MAFAKIQDLTAGQIVHLDGGFTCHLPGPTVIVTCDGGELGFMCCDGQHTLGGQIDEDETVVGVSITAPGVTPKWQQADACPVYDPA